MTKRRHDCALRSGSAGLWHVEGVLSRGEHHQAAERKEEPKRRVLPLAEMVGSKEFVFPEKTALKGVRLSLFCPDHVVFGMRG